MSIRSLLGEPLPALPQCKKTDSLTAAVSQMVEKKLNAIVALNDDGSLAGILSDHDIVRAVHHAKGQIEHQSIADWMSPKVVTCSADIKLAEALKIMGMHRIRHLVVVQDKHPIAILPIREVLSQIHKDDELEMGVLRDMAIASRVTAA